jgi:transcriptional regulator with XRE-family HTH domain
MEKISKTSDDYLYEQRVTIGKQIRALREKKVYSQDDLAEIMEINHSTISKVETGKFAITIDYWAKFAWYLNFNISVVEKQVK